MEHTSYLHSLIACLGRKSNLRKGESLGGQWETVGFDEREEPVSLKSTPKHVVVSNISYTP